MRYQELLKTETYWVTRLQGLLYQAVHDYLKENNKTQKEFAQEIGVSKGYVSQVLNGSADHRISTYVKFAMACGVVPDLELITVEKYVTRSLPSATAKKVEIKLDKGLLSNRIPLPISYYHGIAQQHQVIAKKVGS